MNDGLYKLILADLGHYIEDERVRTSIIANLDALLNEIRTKHENQINAYSKNIATMEYKVETILDAIDDKCDDYEKSEIFKLIINNL